MSEPIVGRRIVRLAVVASTMDEAARLALAGEPQGTIVAAEEQTAGRGRAGRAWQAAAGSAILCSVLLRPPVAAERLSVLPLVVGVAVAEAIEATTGRPCRLKWPNDVLLGPTGEGRKIAGILATARSGGGGVEHVVVGIGINVNGQIAALPPGATSLAAELGAPVDREALFSAVVGRLDVAYRAYVAAAGAPALTGWRERAAFLGEPVEVAVGDRTRRGILRGVAADGALLLAGEAGVERIVAGDLVRGPVRQAGSCDATKNVSSGK